MSRKLLLLAGLALGLSLHAQEPLKKLSLSDAVLKANTDLAPERLDRLA